MRAYESYHDCPMWYPLLSQSMFKISMSGFEERSTTKLELELKENLHPLLVWIDYDKTPTKDNQVLKTMFLSDARFKNIQINLDSSVSDWRLLQAENKKVLLSARPKMHTEFYYEWRDCDKIIKDSVISKFHELRESFKDMFNKSFLDSVEKGSTRYLYEMYARLSSIKDQIEIFRS